MLNRHQSASDCAVRFGLMLSIAVCALQFVAAPSWAQGSHFYGADSKGGGQVDVMAAGFQKQGWKSTFNADIDPTKIWDDIKQRFDNYNPNTGKFNCDGGVCFIYISADGSKTDDGLDTWVCGKEGYGRVKLSELARNIAGAIPACCTLVFTADLCGVGAWRRQFIEPPPNPNNENPPPQNPNNPFNAVNYVVGIPWTDDPTGQERVFGSPIGDQIRKGFGKKRTVIQYSDYLGGGSGCYTYSWAAEPHDTYVVTIPEPCGLLAVGSGTAGMTLLFRRRRRSR